ncbi:MAG: hypothetical protein RLN78_11020 [Phycisphaerales bacterium]
MPSKVVLTAGTMLSCIPAIATAGIHLDDMYFVDHRRYINFIDGETLVSTTVGRLLSGGDINEIAYIGNDTILANMTFGVVKYDLNTGIQETLFTSDEVGGPGSLTFMSGVARRSNGEYYMNVSVQRAAGHEEYGISYNLEAGDLSYVGPTPHTIPNDVYELADGTMLATRTISHEDWIVRYNPMTGEEIALYEIDFTPTAFVQSESELHIVSQLGYIHTFDLSDGSTTFYGRITGEFYGQIMGATNANANIPLIPAPHSLSMLALSASIGFTRRRR